MATTATGPSAPVRGVDDIGIEVGGGKGASFDSGALRRGLASTAPAAREPFDVIGRVERRRRVVDSRVSPVATTMAVRLSSAPRA